VSDDRRDDRDDFGSAAIHSDIHSETTQFDAELDQISTEKPILPTPDLGTNSEVDSDDSGSVDLGPTDLATGAMDAARAIAAGQGGAGRSAVGNSRSRQGRTKRRRRSSEAGGYSGARPDDRDPALIGAILDKSMSELGWVGPLAEARLMSQWASVVGPDIGARCQPVSLIDGELRVAAESTAWATQLRLMAPQVLAKITAELPAGVVRKLIITGPSGPSWRHGPWSVRGGRGVRDTYG
jgi:predicted nucleic acid-binding Zn ribbon protein